MRFTKMHGLGNDYIYFYGEIEEPQQVAVKLSHRHFGVGGDGIIIIEKSQIADFKMRIFNADGSEAKMCGNGIRCVGKYVYDKGYTHKTEITVETLSGIKTLKLELENGKVSSVSVEMGQTQVEEKTVLDLGDRKITAIPVSVGNPHAVTFVTDVENFPLSQVGPLVEKHKSFENGVNAEFVQVIDSTTLRMRVWERGSGITMACGTGACASAAAAVKQKYCPSDVPVKVILDGGELLVKIDKNGNAEMTGPATFVFEGEI